MPVEMKEHQDAMSRQFRQVAGLPERTSDKPEYDPLEPKELRRFAEPEGGFGGEGETEVDERAGKVDEDLVEAQQAAEELSAKSGQGVSEPGGADASTSTDATEKQVQTSGSADAQAVLKAREESGSKTGDKKPAKKTTAKKATSSRTPAAKQSGGKK